MKKIHFLLLTLLLYQITYAQNEPYLGGIGRGDVQFAQSSILLGDPLIYFGGVGRGDVQFTQSNILLGDPLIYYGGVGRGDVQFTQSNILLGDPLIYYGGVGRGDVHFTQSNILLGEALIYFGGMGRGDITLGISSQLNRDQIWIGPALAGNNLFSNSSNWQLGYAPRIGNIKVDNAAVRDMELVANVNFDTLFFQNNTTIQADLKDYNFKLKHFTASTDRQLFKTTGLGSIVIPIFNNGKTLKFPVGNGDYNPVTITNYNTTADSIAVRVGDDVLSEAYSGIRVETPNVLRTWFIKKNNANTLGVDFIYEWDTISQSAPMPGYHLNHFNGTDWEIADFDNYGNPVFNGSRVSITLTGYQGGFSPFTFGDSPLSPLPVELLNFNALLNNRQVELTWQTASEHNNDFFTVERSADGFNFEPIAYVDGAGNSNSLLSYATQDANPFEGVSYYRLKQTDFDGAFEYSDIRVVVKSDDSDLLVFPNPSNTGLINFKSAVDIGELSIYSSEGKLVFKETVGNNLQVKMSAGVYYAHYEVGGVLKSKKIVVSY